MDTHTVLWVFDDEEKLSKAADRALRDTTTEVFVSIASAWEMAIKIRIEKLVFKGGIERFFRMIDESDFVLLPIKRKHVKIIETLPRSHGDPFDRILVASAMSEGMCIITADETSKNTMCLGFGRHRTFSQSYDWVSVFLMHSAPP